MFFEDLHLGQKFPGLRLTVTETHIVLFGSLTGDMAMLHFDDEKAKASQFGKRIAHGMLTSSLAMAVVGPIMGQEAATHLEDSFVYRDPVLIGDTIDTMGEVIELTPKSKWGLVKIGLTTVNQHGRTVLTGWSTVGVRYKTPR